MSLLGEILDSGLLSDLLEHAADAAGPGGVGIVDDEGRWLFGSANAHSGGHIRPIRDRDLTFGEVAGGPGVSASFVAFVARSIELTLAAADDHAERARVDGELAIGRRIQLSLLPRRFPEIPGWTFAADYAAAREIGGDLYDVFRVRGQTDQFALVIADVTGKGIAAALLMADTRALIHAAADNASGPADALSRVNRILVGERVTPLFVTVCLLIVDAVTGVLRMASAGHEPPLIARCDGAIETLTARGPILGAFEDAEFEEQTGRLEPGDALVAYTDGVTEARDMERRFFGEDRLRAEIISVRDRSADLIVTSVMTSVRAFQGAARPFDDLTLLVVSRAPTGPT